MARELDNLRSKYPQYKDIDDITLANKIAAKYPQYKDLPNKVQQDIGTIVETSFMKDIVVRTKRLSAGTVKSLIGDIPFVRKGLPEKVKEYEPYYGYEKAADFATKLGRDIFLMKGAGKLGLGRQALRGAGIGMVTAGTEEPEEILKTSGIGAIALPTIIKATNVVTPIISKIAQKGLKTSRQVWQDLIRAGFMVEKTTVERVQDKGINKVFSKSLGYRDKDAFLKLGNKIFDSAMKLRRDSGKVLNRWKQQIFNNPKIKTSIVSARDTFQNELKKPDIKLLSSTGKQIAPLDLGQDTAKNRLLEINNLLKENDILSPETVYRIIDRLDDLITATKRGTLSIGTNEGRIVAQLRSQLKKSILKSVPKYIGERLSNAEAKFAKIAEVTDDIFQKLPLRKEGVALTERIGATERNLMKGLQSVTPAEERAVYEQLDKLLPQEMKFMELYKDIFAAQDLQREGIGFLLRRLLLSPKIAATGIKLTQPLMKGTGQVIKATGKAAEKLLPPYLLRKSIER